MIKINNLNILAVGDPAVDVYLKEEYSILSDFEKNYNLKLNFNIVSFADYYQELMASFRDYKYDLVMVAGHLWLKEFVEKGYLLELETEFSSDYNYKDILPVIRKEIELEGKRYLLPSFCDGHILIYRSSEINTKLDEICSIDQIKTILENDNSETNIFTLKADPSEIFLDSLPYFRARGVEPFSETGRVLFNNSQGVQALKDYLEMKKYSSANVNRFGNQEVKSEIQQKRCKMAVSWSGQLGEITSENCLDVDDLSFATLNTAWNTTWSFAVNYLTSKQELAEKFMYYISSKEVDKIVGEYCGSPTRLSNFKEDMDQYSWYPVVLKMFRTAKPLPDLENMGNLISICSNQFVKAFNNQISVEEALSNAANKINNN